MGRLDIVRKFAGVVPAILIGMVAVSAVSGTIAYLPSIGPAPMRFEPVMASDAAMAWKLLRPAPAPAEVLAVSASAAGTTTNATQGVAIKPISLATTNIITAVSGPAAGPVDKTNTDVFAGTMMPPVQPGDSSSPITPQLLVDFFKPVPGGKNPAGTAVFTPMEIGFTPPAPKAGLESRAIYKSE